VLYIKIIGLHDGQIDSGACLFEDNVLLSAINEERLTRKKLQFGFPRFSLRKVLEFSKDKKEPDRLIAAGIFTPPIFSRLFRFIQKLEDFHKPLDKPTYLKKVFSYLKFGLKVQSQNPASISGKLLRPLVAFSLRKSLPQSLRKVPLIMVEHHLAHAASAYYTSGKSHTLSITTDACGDGLSFTVNLCRNSEIKRIFSISANSSYGLFYSDITKRLGFREDFDEIKVTGLAAFGNPDKIDTPFPFRISYNPLNVVADKKLMKEAKREISNHSKRDVAAWLQKNLEDQIITIIDYFIKKAHIKDVVLAGGCFANVKLNQRINERCDIDSIYIFPHMGDGGLAVGALLSYLKPRPFKLGGIYYGPDVKDQEIKQVLDKSGLKYKKIKEIEKNLAKLLSKGRIIARFNGRMEFGPRALGNRSVLCETTNKKTADLLNKRLKRTEFMPFAPVTLSKYASRCYKNTKTANYTSKFMTICFECTDYMKKTSPAVVHVDGTARPQILSKEDNPSFYKILHEYNRITGIPSLINTSFNLHGEPIVCTPYDAINTFKQAKLDYLAISNYLVKND